MTGKNTKKRLVLHISGLVQGVFYRWESRGKARELNITGWVKNLPDEKVQIVAEGDIEKLEEFKNWCKTGPRFAKVEKIAESLEEATGEFKEFEIKH